MYVAGAALAQSLTPGDHRLTLGEPPLLTVRARLAEGQQIAGTLPQRCLSASLQPVDPREGAAVPLEWHGAERADDGSTWVTLTHPEPLRLLRMLLRATLHCGPPFTRLQLLQAEVDGTEPARPLAPATYTLPAPPASNAAPGRPSESRSAARALPPPTRPPSPHRPDRASPAPPWREPPPPTPMRSAEPTAAAAASASVPTISTSPALATFLPPTSAVPPAPPPPPAPSASTASPLTDAFMQAWQHDLSEVKRDLLPLQRQVAVQEQRLSRQEDLRRDALGVLLAVGIGAGLSRVASRVWRDISLRRMRAEPALAATDARDRGTRSTVGQFDPPTHPHSSDMPETDAPHLRAAPASRATLDESTHVALYAEVDALRSTGHLDAGVALLETALHGEIDQPPGALLRLLDLYRRLGLADAHGHIADELGRLYAVEVPELGHCALIDEVDVAGTRSALLRRRPELAGRSPAESRQRLAEALLDRRSGTPFSWQDFQAALAWHAELGRRDGRITASSEPATTTPTTAATPSAEEPAWLLQTG
ncbi:hypothetical protein [Leptothrix discophora]|uniref:Uncharacterized protein n=1 Tax=Leptothrix discophora TaxID=89 RepID=A0ABT9G366_LEPDI|nr:hypothetical protein [Leptothrix discophora]MDP4300897.1 hypothetical protein [Leptothrix discophora]